MPPEAGPRLLQSPWNGRDPHCLSQDPAPAQHNQHRATSMSHRANPVPSLGTGTLCNGNAVPNANSSPGTKPGKSDAKAGWEWDQVCVGCWRALQAIPVLPQGRPAASEAQGHCLEPGMFPSALGLVSKQPQPGLREDALKQHLFMERAPQVPGKEGDYRISLCLHVWKQPRLLGRGQLPWGQCTHRSRAG